MCVGRVGWGGGKTRTYLGFSIWLLPSLSSHKRSLFHFMNLQKSKWNILSHLVYKPEEVILVNLRGFLLELKEKTLGQRLPQLSSIPCILPHLLAVVASLPRAWSEAKKENTEDSLLMVRWNIFITLTLPLSASFLFVLILKVSIALEGHGLKWFLVAYFFVNKKLSRIALPHLLASKDGMMTSADVLRSRCVELTIVAHSLIH